MIIELADYELRYGAYATILINRKFSKVLKLFKSYRHPDLEGTGREEIGEQETNLYRTKVFATEIEAYIKIMGVKDLEHFTPIFYGKVNVEQVLDNGIDVSEESLLDCCFEIEFIEGKNYKLTELKGSPEYLRTLESKHAFNLSKLEARFLASGVNYINDSSFIVNESSFKIIDFATIDSQTFHPESQAPINPYDGI